MESGGQEVAIAENGEFRAGTPTECSPQIGRTTSINVNLTPIENFYAGQNIFITGGTGFLGKLLVEKLLRGCPGIGNIYLLVRPKKGKDIHERTEELFDDPVFEWITKKFITLSLSLFVCAQTQHVESHVFSPAIREAQERISKISSSDRGDRGRL